ncbi:MAG: HAD family phosphatase [Butyrivibrio sp.]|uniref:HAD family hydrolase n=1 Tax=Butyrivibrio sp. TaxID=28121 RepID=UPI0025FD54F2|nr:HAD family phosphatase [Butyrivibrio sp.]MCR5771487.1 HAD family phosphatase [Butyrivibrio sp.]
MRPADAVIFDMDGTLTDTEKYYQQAWPEALAHFGYEASSETVLEFRSLGKPFALKRFKELFGEDFDYDLVRDYRRGLVRDLIEKNGIPLKKGAVEILKWLIENNITTAIATANEYARTKRYLEKLGIGEYFDKVICADMVKLGKPAPDIYIRACRELGKEPSRVFAVEDSPNGVKSAYDAGCKVIMVPDLTEPDEELQKMLYARTDDLWEIRKLF